MMYRLLNVNSFLILLFFLFSFSSFGQFRSDPYEIILKNERIVLEENIDDSDNLKFDAQELVNDKYYRILQFHSLPSKTGKQQLLENGIRLLEYIPNKAYTASIEAEFNVSRIGNLGIRSINRIPIKWKQDKHVINQNFDEWAIKDDRVILAINYFEDVEKNGLIRQLKAIDAKILENPDFINLMHVEIPKSEIQVLVEMPFIYFVSQIEGPGTPDDNIGRAMHRNNMIDTDYATGRHYDGSGINILVRDDGFVGPHIDFKGRLNQDDVSIFSGTHADGVAGMAGAAGNLDPTKAGAAKGAFMYVRNYVANFLDGTLNLHLNQDVLLTNSSYSNGCNTGYTTITNTVDKQINENTTLLHIFSAGNSNNNNCDYGAGDQWGNITGGHKQGKNVIATANLNTVGSLVASSSRGPAHDGRIKPDIAAHGQNQISTYPNDTYDPFGGTSAAAPCVMGTTAQLYQAFKELNGGEVPESALIKAILLNTANDIENEGPDFKTGWGHLNAFRAVLTLESNQYTDGLISQGEIAQYNIEVPPNTKQLRAMLYWNDKEATVMTNKALVNDINMSVSLPNGNVELPWVLDPTPDPDLLDLPATKGVDNLNNVEQVLIKNPEPGIYNVNIQGFEIPFNDLKYYLVYDLVSDEDLTLVYPSGGESFVPDEKERLQWDAFSNDGIFLIEYSLDNGSSWNSITSIPGNRRNYDWDIPATITGEALVRISRDGITDQSDVNFSIGPVPLGLHAIQICPDFTRLEWTETIGATSYEVFSLGEKFMESVGTTTDTFMDVPVESPYGEYWYALRALGDNDFIGRRSIAIKVNHQDFNCVRTNDIGIELMAPTHDSYYLCEGEDMLVTINLKNNGEESASDFSIAYQIDGGLVVAENYSETLAPFEEKLYTFNTVVSGLSPGILYNISAMVDYDLDTSEYNDVRNSEFLLIEQENIFSPDLQEDFSAIAFPPDDWRTSPANDQAFWIRADEIIGSDGLLGASAVFPNLLSAERGVEDRLNTFLFDLEGIVAPIATFDLAYAQRDFNWIDSFRVDVYTDCGNIFHSTIYGAAGPNLSTVGDDFFGFFEPLGSENWRNITLDLEAFKDEVIRLSFVNISDGGNNIYLDNINIIDGSNPPVSSINTLEEICVFLPVTIQSNSTGLITEYEWDFGDGATTPTSNEAGPFNILYVSPGLKTISLTVSNNFGTDTYTTEVLIKDTPKPSFEFSVNGLEVSFSNTSEDCQTYLWEFGDGETSFDIDPIHQYPNVNSFTAILMGESLNCPEVQFQKDIDIVTSTEELNDLHEVIIYPNPNLGNFTIQLNHPYRSDYDLSLVDISGKVLAEWQLDGNELGTKLIVNQNLLPGVYFVKIANEMITSVRKVVIQ